MIFNRGYFMINIARSLRVKVTCRYASQKKKKVTAFCSIDLINAYEMYVNSRNYA